MSTVFLFLNYLGTLFSWLTDERHVCLPRLYTVLKFKLKCYRNMYVLFNGIYCYIHIDKRTLFIEAVHICKNLLCAFNQMLSACMAKTLYVEFCRCLIHRLILHVDPIVYQLILFQIARFLVMSFC